MTGLSAGQRKGAVVIDVSAAARKLLARQEKDRRKLIAWQKSGRTRRKLFTSKGERFGRYVVVDPDAGRDGSRQQLVLVQCDCGSKPKTVRLIDLKREKQPTRSCGCWSRERLAAWARSPQNRERVVAWARSPEHRAQAAELGRSPENFERLERLAAYARSPEHRERVVAWARSPEGLEHLARIARSSEHLEWLAAYWSPENRARLAEFNRQFAGSEHEPIDAPDPDWCDRHDLSFYDHSAAQQRQQCYRAWEQGLA
jgi:hypothetical protein